MTSYFENDLSRDDYWKSTGKTTRGCNRKRGIILLKYCFMKFTEFNSNNESETVQNQVLKILIDGGRTFEINLKKRKSFIFRVYVG